MKSRKITQNAPPGLLIYDIWPITLDFFAMMQFFLHPLVQSTELTLICNFKQQEKNTGPEKYSHNHSL